MGFKKNKQTKEVLASLNIIITDTASSVLLNEDKENLPLGRENSLTAYACTLACPELDDVIPDDKEVNIKIKIKKWNVIPITDN